MRGLLERILLSSPDHENTGLESARIIKAPHFIPQSINQTMGKKENRQNKPDHSQKRALNSKPQRNTNRSELQATAQYKELGTRSHSEIQRASPSRKQDNRGPRRSPSRLQKNETKLKMCCVLLIGLTSESWLETTGSWYSFDLRRPGQLAKKESLPAL